LGRTLVAGDLDAARRTLPLHVRYIGLTVSKEPVKIRAGVFSVKTRGDREGSQSRSPQKNGGHVTARPSGSSRRKRASTVPVDSFEIERTGAEICTGPDVSTGHAQYSAGG
jgi:hypothetical protein